MKISKNTLLIFLLLIITHTTHSMDKPSWKKRSQWLATAGEVLLGTKPIKALTTQKSTTPSEFSVDLPTSEPKTFADLPKDMRNKIFGILTTVQYATSLQEAAQQIKILAQVNKEWNGLLNDPQYCLQLIKHLSKKFNKSDGEISRELQIPEANNRQKLQNNFSNELKTEHPNKDTIKNLIKMGADPNWLEDYNNPRYPLTTKLFSGNLFRTSDHVYVLTTPEIIDIVKILIDSGANPHLRVSTIPYSSNESTILKEAKKQVAQYAERAKITNESGDQEQLKMWKQIVAILEKKDN